MPHNFIFQAVYFLLPKRLSQFFEPSTALIDLMNRTVYTNSLMATLNARHKLRQATTDLVSIPLSVVSSSRPEGSDSSGNRECVSYFVDSDVALLYRHTNMQVIDVAPGKNNSITKDLGILASKPHEASIYYQDHRHAVNTSF